MKKALAAILLVVYAVVSTGFVISIHYCMDKVNAVQLGVAARKACDKCGMPLKDSKGCCKDEVRVFKMKVDQSLAKLVKTELSLSLPVISHSQYLLAPFINEIKISAPVAHGPPLSEQDTYLQNRVFRL